jgi:N2-acetyl-L-2,4-diaminobutanoate deacetylase
VWNHIKSSDFSIPSSGTRHLDVALPFDVSLPISIKSGSKGLTVLLIGGTHGDEYEGQMAALEFARALEGLTVFGRLIIVPFHNLAACRAGSRTSPGDGRDLNRCYGANLPADHGPSTAIADFVSKALISEADVIIDLHSGGASSEFIMSSNLQAKPHSTFCEEMLPALKAFNAPDAIIFDETDGAGMPHKGTVEGFANSLGKKSISSELGGAARLTIESLAIARHGVTNLLHHFGVVRSSAAVAWTESRSRLLKLSGVGQSCRSPATGWFLPSCSLGEHVRAGDEVGHVVRDDGPSQPSIPVAAKVSGIICCMTASTRVEEHEEIVDIAEFYDESFQRSNHPPKDVLTL